MLVLKSLKLSFFLQAAADRRHLKFHLILEDHCNEIIANERRTKGVKIFNRSCLVLQCNCENEAYLAEV